MSCPPCVFSTICISPEYPDLDWIAQISIKFKCQLKLKCKLIACTVPVNFSRNYILIDT